MLSSVSIMSYFESFVFLITEHNLIKRLSASTILTISCLRIPFSVVETIHIVFL